MEHPGFFKNAGPFPLSKIAEVSGASLNEGADKDLLIEDIKPLDSAQSSHVSFLDNAKYLSKYKESTAAACFVNEKYSADAPEGLTPLVSKQPYHSFAKALFLFYPESRCSLTAIGNGYDGNLVHPSAELEEGVVIEPGAVVGPEVKIGSGTRIAAGAVIGYRVYIGRDCYIGPNVNISHSLLGNNVIIHNGTCVGQDGFGFAMGPEGHLKVPQIGRVVIQDDVEIGANTTIDRGALNDTIIGQGTKIDNLVQIAHNVVIGRNCVIVAQVGISGSTELGDFVVFAGQAGAVGHLKVGSGVQVAAKSALTSDVPPGQRWGGIPAKPIRQWHKEVLYLKKMASKSSDKKND